MGLLTYIKSPIFTKNIFHTYSPVESSEEAASLLSHFNHLNTPHFKITLLRTLAILPIIERKEVPRALLPCAFTKVNKIILSERHTKEIFFKFNRVLVQVIIRKNGKLSFMQRDG